VSLVARGEGERGKRGPNHTCFWPCVGKWWTEAARQRGTESAAVVGGGGDAPMRERARGPAVQPWCEAEKVIGGMVWAMWGRSCASMRGWQDVGVGLGAASSGASGGAFIGLRRRMVAWARAAGEGATTGSKIGDATALLSPARLAVAPTAPAVGKCHRVEAS
jgi:hypothetical protein